MVVRKRLNIAGPAIAFITTTVFEWKPILTQMNVADTIIEEIQKTQSLFQCSMISYVIMPSHIHLLMGFANIDDLSKYMQSFKSITSRRIKRFTLQELAENDFKLWKPRFDDLIIQSERQLRIKMEYIHNNPVKAGLVENAEDWPYSSAVDWLTSNGNVIKIDKAFHWLTK
ncbi:MAG: transposase [candidate division Zixibacteria bacterium]|nr:transposase [candidate division Zixibacteria bacterium]